MCPQRQLDDLVHSCGFVDRHDNFDSGASMLCFTTVFGTAFNPFNEFGCLRDVLVRAIRRTFFPISSLVVEETDAPLCYIGDAICPVDDATLIVRSADLLREHTDAAV